MLILARKAGQSIFIGDDIKIEITDIVKGIDGRYVASLGIDAPKHVCVDREEVRAKRLRKIETVFNGGN